VQQNKVLITRRTSHKSFPCKCEFPGRKINGMLKLEDHDRIAWVPVENLLRYDMTEADHLIREALVRLFLNFE
jgi:hypothetical protein